MALDSSGVTSSCRVDAACVLCSRRSRWMSRLAVIWSAKALLVGSLPFRFIRWAVTLVKALNSSSEREETSGIPNPPSVVPADSQNRWMARDGWYKIRADGVL